MEGKADDHIKKSTRCHYHHRVSAGRRNAKNPAGGGEKEGGDFSFPGDAERYPGSDAAARREERQPSTGERRARREAEETV